MVPDVRIELTTYRLQGDCSTTKLIRQKLASRRLASENVYLRLSSSFSDFIKSHYTLAVIFT